MSDGYRHLGDKNDSAMIVEHDNGTMAIAETSNCTAPYVELTCSEEENLRVILNLRARDRLGTLIQERPAAVAVNKKALVAVIEMLLNMAEPDTCASYALGGLHKMIADGALDMETR